MINPLYKNKQIIRQMQFHFKNSGILKLDNFYTTPESISKQISKQKFIKKYSPAEYSFEESKKIPINKKELKKFLSNFSKVINLKLNLKIYAHRGYTLLNDYQKMRKIGFIIDFTKKWNNDSNGYTSFIKNNIEILRIYPEYNNITIVNTKNNVKNFVKYVNCLAKTKRIVVEGSIP